MQMSKGEFASHIGVSPGRVSQMISEGLIGRDALVGEGRSARVMVEKAVEQIRARRNVGQALGNGLGTRLQATDRPLVPDTQLPSRDPDTAELIQRERLVAEQRKNRLAEVEEAQRLGDLVTTDDMRRELGKALQRQLNAFTGMVPDFANAISAQYGLPARDLVHLIRKVMNEKRGEAANAEASTAKSMPATIEVVLK